jgi:hypothetical protein
MQFPAPVLTRGDGDGPVADIGENDGVYALEGQCPYFFAGNFQKAHRDGSFGEDCLKEGLVVFLDPLEFDRIIQSAEEE